MRLSLPYAPETPDFVDTPQGRVAVPERMTATEFAAFPFNEKDHWELIEGSPVMSPAPNVRHQKLCLALISFLESSLQGRPGLELLYDVDVAMAEHDTYLRPDVLVVRTADLPESGAMPLTLVPQLIVEVLSPSTGGRDIGIKREIYARNGVPEYWVADPATGALSVFIEPAAGDYRQQLADEDGYVVSPFVGMALRIQRSGHRYRVLAR